MGGQRAVWAWCAITVWYIVGYHKKKLTLLEKQLLIILGPGVDCMYVLVFSLPLFGPIYFTSLLHLPCLLKWYNPIIVLLSKFIEMVIRTPDQITYSSTSAQSTKAVIKSVTDNCSFTVQKQKYQDSWLSWLVHWAISSRDCVLGTWQQYHHSVNSYMMFL